MSEENMYACGLAAGEITEEQLIEINIQRISCKLPKMRKRTGEKLAPILTELFTKGYFLGKDVARAELIKRGLIDKEKLAKQVKEIEEGKK